MRYRQLGCTVLATLAVGGFAIWMSATRHSLPVDLTIRQPVLDSNIATDDATLRNSDSLLDQQPRRGGVPAPRVADVSEPPQSESPELWKGIDIHGRLQRIGQSDGCLGTVYVFLNVDCPIANASIPRLNRLHQEFGSQIELYGVVTSSTTRRAARQHVADFAISFPVLCDGTGELQTRLQATHSPHAFLLNSYFETVYRGSIDDSFPSLTKRRAEPSRHFLRDAIQSLVTGTEPLIAATEPVGCRLATLPTDSVSTQLGRPKYSFARHIAPLIHGNCSTCHQPNAVAPFSLLSYDDVVRHAPQIRVVVEHRLMPPWKPKHGFGDFRNEQRLSQVESDMLIEWIDSSMPLGDESELPVPPLHKDGWQLGSPDLVLEVEQPFAVVADGPDVYQYFVIPTELLEDRLVSAVEYQPGNARVVHHASFRYDDAGNARKLDEAFPGPGYQRFGGWGFLSGGTLGGWAMGVASHRMPVGFGRPLKAGSDFVIQTHYHPSGKLESDQGKVGIHFAPRSTQRRVAEIFVANMNLHIPPNEQRYLHRASYQLPCDVALHAVLPHAHMLAREVRAWATLPTARENAGPLDSESSRLIQIEDWDFNWQGNYAYRKPVRLSAGTTIHFEVEFDNSNRNPLNPHAIPKWVHWGEDSAQEMAVCFFDVTTDSEAELDRLIDHNRSYIANQPGNRPARPPNGF